ncbi:hypothetical protein B0I35DRAFT_219986 [Stachybotrys elegans]|uniref:Uncharacterized protein n=1 Tax=Stachybotrys elegans TaxID=80388 RepID=A0A8K0WRA3_9HYPO|nr:hypothetical protein B0I35DRAFT_219986 [Stachybotrys elegans]
MPMGWAGYLCCWPCVLYVCECVSVCICKCMLVVWLPPPSPPITCHGWLPLGPPCNPTSLSVYLFLGCLYLCPCFTIANRTRQKRGGCPPSTALGAEWTLPPLSSCSFPSPFPHLLPCIGLLLYLVWFATGVEAYVCSPSSGKSRHKTEEEIRGGGMRLSCAHGDAALRSPGES